MNIHYYLSKSFRTSMLKLFPLSVVYYLYFIIASIVLNLTISPLLVGVDKNSLQVNPFDVLELMKNNLNAMGNIGIIKFFIAVSLAITLLISIYLFIDAANRFTLLSTSIDEKQRFNIKFYIFVGNLFLRRFFQIAISFILLFSTVFLLNYALNELSLFITRVFSNLIPLLKYSIEIIIFTFISGIFIFTYLFSAFIYYFLPAIIIVNNCSFSNALRKLFGIVKSFRTFLKYLLFTIAVTLVAVLILVVAISIISVSVSVPALYPFLFILYTFMLIFTILLTEASTQLYYYDNQITQSQGFNETLSTGAS